MTAPAPRDQAAPDPSAPGPVQRVTELIAPGPVEALAGLLGTEVPVGELPPLWHVAHLLDRPPQHDLGADGHALSGIPAPPGPGRRRMVAGGRVTTHRLLRIGEPATRTTRLVGTVTKEGRSGRLTFSTARSELTQAGRLAVVEETQIVYRDPSPTGPVPGSPAPDEPGRGSATLALAVDETVLFRFSALTYNAHRIHYDLGWAQQEGYAGLVVHGPLQLLLMAELVRRHGGGLLGREISYRLVAPMIGPQTATAVASADRSRVEVRDGRGVVTATGHVGPARPDAV